MFASKYSLDKKINNPDSYNFTKDLIWCSPDGFDLTMDIYSPKKPEKPLPVIVMFHGGGFLIRRKEILNNMAQYIASNHDYVVCNVNYRLLQDQNNSVSFDELIGDSFGSILWIKENIANFNGDKNKIGITGDSAGAYICAMILNSGDKVGLKENFNKDFCIEPSYIPKNLNLFEIAEQKLINVNAAVLSYGGYDFYKWALLGHAETYKNPFWWLALSRPRGIFGNEYNPKENAEMYQAVSPVYNIPESSDRLLPPQLLTSATKDKITPPSMIEEYVEELKAKGQQAEYWEHEGRNHAYLDSGYTFYAGNDFKRDGIPALKKMLTFFDQHLQ